MRMRTYIVHGREFKVLAVYSDNNSGTQLANDFMTLNPGAAVLAVEHGRVILAHVDDKGTVPTHEDCEQCGGYGSGPDCEEGSGIPYTCYACGATGRVPYGTAAAQRLESAQAAGFATVEAHEADIKARNDAWTAELARRDAERNALLRNIAIANDDIDDIPF